MKNVATLSDLQQIVAKFRDERGWKKYHNPKNLVISILVEAAELAEHFQWETTEESHFAAPPEKPLATHSKASRDEGGEEKQRVAAELVDVLWYCLSLADRLNIDMADAFLKKFVHNQNKFPKDKSSDVEFVRKQRERYRRMGK